MVCSGAATDCMEESYISFCFLNIPYKVLGRGYCFYVVESQDWCVGGGGQSIVFFFFFFFDILFLGFFSLVNYYLDSFSNSIMIRKKIPFLFIILSIP